MRAPLTVLALSFAAVATLLAQPTVAPDTLTVGVLREDSVLIPFARFNGKTWRKAWRDPDSFGSTIPPVILTEIPTGWWAGGGRVLNWELTRRNGARQRVRVVDTTVYDAAYATNIGLRTNYVTRLSADTSVYQFPLWDYAGAVANRPGVLAPVREIPKTTQEFQRLNRLLPRTFARVEPRSMQSKHAPELVGAHSAALPDGRELVILRAHHNLEVGYTVLEMWLSRRGDSAFQEVSVNAYKTDSDMKGAGAFVPMASVVLGGRTFWTGLQCDYEGGAFAIVEVGNGPPKRVLFTGDPGAC